MLITDHDDGGRCKKRLGHDHGADNNEDDDADDNSDDNDTDADDEEARRSERRGPADKLEPANRHHSLLLYTTYTSYKCIKHIYDIYIHFICKPTSLSIALYNIHNI